MQLTKKIIKDLDVRIEPSNKLLDLAAKYGVPDPRHDIDWKTLLELRKDFGSDGVFIEEAVIPHLKEYSVLNSIEIIALERKPMEIKEREQRQEQEALLGQQKKAEQEYHQILEEIKTKPTPNIDKMVWEITEWLELMLSNKTRTHTIFVAGRAGIGKTHTIKKVLKKHFNIEQLKGIIQGGSITPLRYYCSLYDNREGIFYWNDLDKTFFNETKSIAMLKQSTETQSERKVDYDTTSPKLGNRLSYCIFKGKQIFDLNTYPKNNEFKTILSRSPPIKFNPTNREIILMGYEIVKEDFLDINLKKKIKVMNFIQRNVSEATKNFDLRKIVWFMDLYRHIGEINNKFKRMANSLLEIDIVKEIILELSKSKATIGEQEKEFIEKAAKLGLPKSRASFYIYRNELGLTSKKNKERLENGGCKLYG